ncbi:MAG: transglycosylase domain-containing protein [Myxococcales bacterium]|nr:transglycosylase domain-containing protein [Myxococcales bacterium]
MGCLVLVIGQAFSSCGNEQAIRERISRIGKDRYGLYVRMGKIRMGLRGIELRDVVAHNGPHGGFLVRMREVKLALSPMAMLTSGSHAISRVQAQHIDVQMDVMKPGFKPWLRQRLQVRAARGGRRLRARGMAFDDLRVVVKDQRGVLIDAAQGTVNADRDGEKVGFRRCDIGARPAEVLELRDFEILIGRLNGRSVLKAATTRSAALSFAQGELRTRGRLRALTELIAESRGPLPTLRAGPDEPLRWLAPDARLRMGNLAIELRETKGGQHLLKQLHGELTGNGKGLFVAKGEGRVHGGGAMTWNLKLWPSQVRAEGAVTLKQVPLALFVPLLPELPWHEPQTTWLDGQLSLRTKDVVNVAVAGKLHIRDVSLYSPKIAEHPVSADALSIEGAALWRTGSRRLELSAVHVTLEQLHAEFTGVLERNPAYYLVDLRASLPQTPCNTVIAAVPRALMDDTVNFSWSGNWMADISLHIDSRDFSATDFAIKARNQCRFESVPALADMRTFQGPFLHRVYEPDGSVFEMETGPGTARWTPIEAISPFMLHAVLAQEDAGFFRHAGFATAEIGKALGKNLRAGRYVQGASTISMQLVKNLLLHREKTLARKVQEVLLTWWIEEALDKKKILELYLNVIEFGPAVYGIRQAASYYFGSSPRDLTPAQAVFLSLILPNPKAYAAQAERDTLTDRWKLRIRHRLEHLFNRGRIDALALEYGVQELATFQFQHGGAAASSPGVLGQAAPLPFQSVIPSGPAGTVP